MNKTISGPACVSLTAGMIATVQADRRMATKQRRARGTSTSNPPATGHSRRGQQTIPGRYGRRANDIVDRKERRVTVFHLRFGGKRSYDYSDRRTSNRKIYSLSDDPRIRALERRKS